MGTLGLSKVFILDKYFTELQKFWETEKKLQDASSSNEAVHLQQRLRSLSTELVTLRNRLHVQGGPGQGGGGPNGQGQGGPNGQVQGGPTSPHAPPVAPKPLPAHPISPEKCLALLHPGHIIHQPLPPTPLQLQVAQQHAPPPPPPQLPAPAPVPAPRPHSPQCAGQRHKERERERERERASLKSLASTRSLNGVNTPGPDVTRPPSQASQAAGLGLHADLHDLIHLPGPLTEDAVLKCLHSRFLANQLYTNVGPILLSVNAYHDVGNPLTLTSTRGAPLAPQLLRVVQDAVRQQAENGYPQAMILSGCSGSGKTYASMLLLRQLFDVAGGGPETDAFKHLAAAFTVLRALGSAKTASNSEASRIGHFIEVQVTDGALYRTKIHCYFLDQTRVIRPAPNEKNYHIFYQLLAGLTTEERVKLNLDGYTVHNLNYLRHGDTHQDEAEDAARFQAWKACLGVLGIPFLDVIRVLAAVLLLGNVQFVADTRHPPGAGPGRQQDAAAPGVTLEVQGEAELKAVANLLGVSGPALCRGLTSRTHNARGQLVRSVCDANMSNMTRDSLAKALYCRTVATIVRRANSLKRLGSTLGTGTLSSDSNESVHNQSMSHSHAQSDALSQHASTVGTAGSKSSKSMAALNNAVRHVQHATDGFIGILDMFGFEDPKPSQLEHLCINLCAETMQHFYNTHIFKSSIESCREEGIHTEVEVDYVDNVPCIDLISSLRTGLLSMLDVECSVRGSAETYLAKVRAQHKHNPRLFEPRPLEARSFGIQHFAGRVVYDVTDFLDTNKDVVPDDLVSVFHKQTCNFGFATHLFGSELKALFSSETVPRGVSFRISPTSHTDLLNGDEPVSTLTQDFHTRLDNLLRTLVHARPHFVRCVRSNATETPGRLERATVMRQIRSLQVLETVNLMAGGFPHRMRFKAFNARYRLLAPHQVGPRAGAARGARQDDKDTSRASEDCALILQHLQAGLDLDNKQSQSQVSTGWAVGKRHIFLSEGARQQLETARWETRHVSAVRIQSRWRGYRARKRWPALRRSLAANSTPAALVGRVAAQSQRTTTASTTGAGAAGAAGANNTGTITRPRPQPIAGTPPPDPSDKCDHNVIQQTCTLFGLDLERPPPVPPSRAYTVTGNTKLGYPQTRLIKMPFPEDGSGEVQLLKGDQVLVLGASPRRGHLLVEHNNVNLHVPYQFLELLPGPGPVSI